jgi:predicted kinase
VIFVNGLPASGKTTLSTALASSLQLPLFSKDHFKEALFDTLGWGERDWSRKLGAASMELLFRALESQLAAGCSCIAESNFEPELGAGQVRALEERFDAQWIQILCVADGAVLQVRYRERVQQGRRHPGHMDTILEGELGAALASGRLAPMPIGGALIEVDTTAQSPGDLERLIATLRGLIGSDQSSC